MKPAIHKLLTHIRFTFDTVTSSIRAFWQRHRPIIGWVIGLTLLILLAAALFVWLWSRSQLFRTLVLIVVAALVTDSTKVINWLRELQDTVDPAPSLTRETAYDPHEEQGGEVSQGLKVEPDPSPA
jgi:hypothetical protein